MVILKIVIPSLRLLVSENFVCKRFSTFFQISGFVNGKDQFIFEATPSIFLILKHSLVEPVLKMAHYTNKLIGSGCTVLTNDKLTQR